MDLSDDPTVVVGAQGDREIPRPALGAMLEAPTWQLLSYEIEDFIVREVAPGQDQGVGTIEVDRGGTTLPLWGRNQAG